MKTVTKIACYLYLALISQSLSQEEFIKFTTVSIEDGLSVSVASDIIQDNLGYIWIATQDGLNRYNGYTFKIFRHEDENPNSISDNEITALAVDKSGFIWAATSLGLDRYDPNIDQFKNFSFNASDDNSISSNQISKLFVDKSGALWIATENGLNLYNSKTESFTRYLHDENDVSTISSNIINDIFEDDEKQIWIGTDNGLNLLKGGQFEHFVSSGRNSLANNNVLSIIQNMDRNLWIATSAGITILNKSSRNFTHQGNSSAFRNFPSFSGTSIKSMLIDKQNQIWIGTSDNGLYQYSNTEKNFTSYKKNPSDINSLSSDNILRIFEDKSGLIWVGTVTGGLTKIRYSSNKHIRTVANVIGSSNSLISDHVTAIIIDQNNNVWYGTLDKGISRYNPRNRRFTHYSTNSGLPSTNITSFAKDSKGNIWVGTDAGLAQHLSNNRFKVYKSSRSNSTLPSNLITSLFFDPLDQLWIGTDNGFSSFNASNQRFTNFQHQASEANSLPDNNINVITEDKTTNLWIGTNGGLVKFEKFKNVFTRYQKDPQNNKSLSHNRVFSIHIDDENNVWAGTANGLNKLTKGSDSFFRVGVEDGLSNSFIYSVLEDNRNNLWMSTNYGITRYNYTDFKIRNFDTRDGLQSNQFNKNAFFQSTDGTLYFGGLNGVNFFSPKDIITNVTIPQLVFSDFRVNYLVSPLDSNINSYKQITLDYEQNNIAFEVAALEFTIPEKNQYDYMLEGFDPDWIRAGGERTISYTNLDPQVYTFRVRASNNDLMWNPDGRSLVIDITPPFWKPLWFQITAALVSIMLIVSVPLIMVRRGIQRQEKLEAEIAERTKEIADANKNLSKENEIRKETEVALLRARSQTDAILENVVEGLFLLDTDYKISDQHSKELEEIFNETNLSQVQFVELMRPLITAKNLEALKDFVELLFNPDIDEEVVNELNPLDQVEVHFEIDKGEFKSKHLEFSFRRITSEEEIHSLLITVRDVSEIVELQIQLKLSEEKNKTEIDQLLSILKVDPHQLKDYLDSVKEVIDDISIKFEQEKGGRTDILDEVFRTIHNLKGNAQMLDLKFFVEKFHSVESAIRDIQDKSEVKGDDFLGILFDINEIESYVNSMFTLIKRVLKLTDTMKTDTEAGPDDGLVKNIEEVVGRLGKQLDKKAKFIFENPNIYNIPNEYRNEFKDIVIQLVRNSMVHGIENNEERRSHNKNPEAQLRLILEDINGNFVFRYRDDGQGLNIDKIKQKALNSGKYTSEKLDTMTKSEIARLIFSDGLSTSDSADENSGRGQGMSIIKDIISRKKGKIKFSYASGKYFEMGFELPLHN